MPALLEEIFIITSEDKYLPFFNRYQGQSGRDIAAIKLALGNAFSSTLDGDELPVDNSIGESWFECGTNQPITPEQLIKFDKKFKLDLMAFQLQYQFVIVSYFFEKYCVEQIEKNSQIPDQVQAAVRFFDVEFGSIGEGTVAVLHGWRPGSLAYNHSFVADFDRSVDEVPKRFFDLVGDQALIQTPPTDTVQRFLRNGDDNYDDTRQFFEENYSFAKRINQKVRNGQGNPTYAIYTPTATPLDPKDSRLFTAAKSIMDSEIEANPSEMIRSDRQRILSPILEPDHLSDPDPFYIDRDRIGVFERTEFTLENLPDFSNMPQEAIQMMEDMALTRVLQFYGKLPLWQMKRDLTDDDIVSFATEEDAEIYKSTQESLYYVTTQTLQESVQPFLREAESFTGVAVSAQNYISAVQSLNGNHPVKFIEFRTPSLRPGDVYRAYFEISRTFIDRISTGISQEEINISAGTNLQGSNTAEAFEALRQEIVSRYCIENSSNEKEARTKQEKYRAFAMKKKLEVSREIRNKAILAATMGNTDINIDLGVAGNIPLLNLLDDTSLGFDDIGDAIGNTISNAIARELPPAEASNPMVIHFSDLEEGITQLVKSFKSDEAKKDVQSYKVKSNGQPLNLDREADNLSPIPRLLRGLILNSDEFIEAANLSDATPEEILDEKRTGINTNFSGTKIIITFSESGPPKITDIFIENKRYFESFKPRIWSSSGGFEPLKGVLTIPRTVNYLKNIYNLIPLGVDNWQQFFEQFFGIGSAPCSEDAENITAGAGLIMRYTINSDGTVLEFEEKKTAFNPFHDWKEDLLEREEVKRISDAYDQTVRSEVLWGVDTAIPQIGPTCTLDELYRDIINKMNLSKLLCDFASCINIPNVNIKLPNLNLPEIPDIPIFQYPWLDKSKIQEQIEAALLQMLCAFVRNLFDILSSPFCEDQLRRDLYGAASDVSPDIQKAFAGALTDTGVPKEKSDNASNFIGDIVNFLTPREICALLTGQPVNRQTYNIIQNLSVNYNLEVELDSVEKINIFFESIGIFVPSDLINRLCVTDNLLGAQTCEDTASVLAQIRSAATRDGVDEAKVQEAVDLAEKNLMSKSKALELLSGDFGLDDLIPDFETGEELTKGLQESSKIALRSALTIPKLSFISSMKNYIPSLYLSVSSLVSPDDPEYDPEATMRFLRAATNLQAVSSMNLQGRNFTESSTVRYIKNSLLKLCDDYETMMYTTPSGQEIEVYRSQIYPPPPEESFEHQLDTDEDSTELPQTKTTLRGSLMFQHDSESGFGLSQEAQDRGLRPLFSFAFNSDQDPGVRASNREDLLKAEYRNIQNYLFPLSLTTMPIDFSYDPNLSEEEQQVSGQGIDPYDPATHQPSTITIDSWEVFTDQNSVRINSIEGVTFTATGRDSGVIQFNHSINSLLCGSYLRKLSSVMTRYQRDIEDTIEKVFKVVSREKFLEVIKDFYDIDLEASRQEGSESQQLITSTPTEYGVTTILKHPTPGLTETTMTDINASAVNVSCEIKIDDGFFFGTPEAPTSTITVCDEVPEKYQEIFDLDNDENPMRRLVFKEQILDISKRLYDNYRVPEAAGFPTLETFEEYISDPENSARLSDMTTDQFEEVHEGTLEQLISYIGESRMLTDPGYLGRLEAKIKSRSFVQETDGSACIINPNNLFSEGPIKFDELVTNWFAEQYQKELVDPVNSIYTRDYRKPGAFEKALMTTTVLGFIRVVCLDALLKGALSYNTWDMSFLVGDKLFYEYMCLLVERAFDKERPFVENRVLVDNVFLKVVGTSNRKLAIRKIVNKEIHGYIGELSKILFENDPDFDYYSWFLSKMKIVNAPLRRREEEQWGGMWISELKESDINTFRKNSFTFLERYIRVSGDFELTLGPREEVAENQRNALFRFIRFNSDSPSYHESFENKLYDENDPEFLEVPIELDIPTRQETLDMDLGDSEVSTDTLALEDNDAWPTKELYSLEDFEEIIRSLYSQGTGVDKYVFHLLKKHYDPIIPALHGRPKTLVNKLPIKAIKRNRTYYRIRDKDRFSSKLLEEYETVFPPRADGFLADPLARVGTSREYHKYINPLDASGEGRDINTGGRSMPSSDLLGSFDFDDNQDIIEDNANIFNQLDDPNNKKSVKIKYNGRYYISSTNGANAIMFENEEDIDSISFKFKQNYDDGNNRSPNRGATLVKITPEGVEVNPLDPDSEPELTSVDKITGGSQDWVDQDIRGQDIFSNQTGKVSQELYQRLTDTLEDSIEQETWDEYIIDLTDDAAPIFNQPGYSAFTPGDYLSVGAKQDMALKYFDAIRYNSNHGEGIRHLTVHPNKDDIRNKQSNVVSTNAGPIHAGFTFAPRTETYLATDQYYSSQPDTTVVDPMEVFPAKGIQYVRSNQSIRNAHGRAASGYAFYKNDIRLEYDHSIRDSNDVGLWKLDNSAKEILGENDYKMPLRILITQVKDKNGNIKQCYVRYLIPKLATFGEYHSDDEEEYATTRAAAVYQAALQSMEAYVNFFHNSLERLRKCSRREEIPAFLGLTPSEEEIQACERIVFEGPTDYVNDAFQWNRNDFGQLQPPETRRTGEEIQVYQSKVMLANLMMGRRGKTSGGTHRFRDNGIVPVLFRSYGNELPNNSSWGPAFMSNEKFWSLAAATEVADRKDHFVIDENSNEFSNFDAFFEHTPGNLLRRSTGQYDPEISGLLIDEQPGSDHAQGLFEDNGKFVDENYGRDADNIKTYLQDRHRVYSRASRHFLYSRSVEDLIEDTNNDTKHHAIISIGNLVGWFNQRRVDGFYGATTRAIRAGFSVSGNTKGYSVIQGGRATDVFTGERLSSNNRSIDPIDSYSSYRLAAADYDCGPSMFYGDKRNLGESFQVELKKALDPNFPPDGQMTGVMISSYLTSYTDELMAYANQNAHKVHFHGNYLNFAGARNQLEGNQDIHPGGFPGGLTDRQSSDDFNTRDIDSRHPGPDANLNIRRQYKEMILERFSGKKRKSLTSMWSDAQLTTKALLKQFEDVMADYEVNLNMPRNIGQDADEPTGNEIFPRIATGNGYLTPNITFSIAQTPDNIIDSLATANTNIDDVLNSYLDYVVHGPGTNIEYNWEWRSELLLRDDIAPVKFTVQFPKSTRVSSAESLNAVLSEFESNLRDKFDLGGESVPSEIMDRLTNLFDQAVRHADPLLDAIRNIMVGLDPSINDFVEQLNIKHGLRLNLVLDHNINTTDDEKTKAAEFIRVLFNRDSEVGEEERTGRMHYETDLTDGLFFEKMVVLPIASFERSFNEVEKCGLDPFLPGMNFSDIIISRDPQMIKSLSEVEDFKSFYEFSIPYRRMATLLTIHGTSMLAGYSTMPKVLTSTRAGLASAFKIMAQRDNLEATMANQFGEYFDNISLLNSMGADFPAGGEPPDCFSLDGLNGDWFKMIAEMIEQFIYYFPSVIFRGIADQLDPAYKEMKSHYYACELPTLNMDALAISAGNGKTPFGLRGDERMNKEYIPVNTAFPFDSIKGIAKMLPFNSDGGKYLGRSINRLVTYIVGGPMQLLDASYAFQIPCLADQTGQDFRNWNEADWAQVGQFGRYGHPLSLFTLLALPTAQLPRDLEYRRQTCTMQDTRRANEGIDLTECSDTEE